MAEAKLRDPSAKLRSKVWQHFGFRENTKDTATCRMCYTDVKFKAGATTNLSTHLKRKHNLNVSESDQASSSKLPKTESETETKASSGQLKLVDVVRKQKLNEPQKVAITKAIGGYLAYDMCPYSTVENDGFKYMISVLEPRYSLPSRPHFSQKVIPEIWTNVKDRITARLAKAEAISITTDSWTSRSTENFVAVTAHFINSDWQVENYTLQTKKFSESHTAENLAKGLQEVVSEWKLERNGRGPAIATDNASNIVRAVRESALKPHVTCFAHTLNIATQRGLKVQQMDKLLGRVRRVVTFFHKSTSATSTLEVKQEKLELPKHRLIMDVATRWNSTYNMLERYVEQQAAVFASVIELKKNAKDIITLSDDDVHNIEEVLQILQPIKTVTTMMCSQKHPTVSLIHPLKEMLLQRLNHCPADNTLVREVKKAITSDLEPRYKQDHILDFLLQASALDPRFKSLPYLEDGRKHEVFHTLAQQTVDYFTQSQQDVVVKTEPVDCDVAGQSLPSLPKLPPISSTAADEVDDASETCDKEKQLQQSPVKVKQESENNALSELFGDVFITKVVKGSKSIFERVEDEITNYKEEGVLKLESDPLLWWKQMAWKFPLLSNYAKCCLGVPATSVASERVFSTAGDVVTAQRARLSSDNVDMLVFLSQNMTIPDDLQS